VFVVFVNALAAALGLLAILFYSVVYTLVLKPHTTQNIVIIGGSWCVPCADRLGRRRKYGRYACDHPWYRDFPVDAGPLL